MKEWISVNDKLPEKGGLYLVFGKYHDREIARYLVCPNTACNRFEQYDFNTDYEGDWEKIHNITHWMKRPPKPEDERK